MRSSRQIFSLVSHRDILFRVLKFVIFVKLIFYRDFLANKSRSFEIWRRDVKKFRLESLIYTREVTCNIYILVVLSNFRSESIFPVQLFEIGDLADCEETAAVDGCDTVSARLRVQPFCRGAPVL